MLQTFKTTPRDIGKKIEPESIEEWLLRGGTDLREVSIPYGLPILIGEIVYNLRCALDYLVFALAWHDTGIEPTDEWAKRLQFPCESEIDRFERRKATLLKGISEEHVAIIREYQPGAGCNWTPILVGLSDSDKHRHLSVLAGSFDSENGVWRSRTIPHPDAVPDERGFYAIEDVNVEVEATLDVVFPDGRLVAEALQELEAKVGEVLRRFAREFVLWPVS